MLKLNIQMFADGKVVIETDLDNKGFSKGLDKVKSIAASGFKGIATAVGATAAAMTALVAKSVSMAGELEQQIGGTEAVFGKFADTVQDKAAGAFDKMGISANDFMATANKMGALMQGSGISIEDSMELSTAAMQRAADVASIMGIDVNSAMESIAGAAKGNFTMMDNLGVAMNATTIEAYAMSKGITTSYNEMDNATKVGLAMEMFLEKTAYAEGNYAKENETFAGSFSTLKASISNFLSGAGGIEDVAKSLVSFGKILTKSIKEMAPSVVNGLVDLVKAIIPEITPLLQSLLPVVISGATELINGLIEIFPAIVQLIQDNLPTIISGAIMIIQTLIMTMLNMLPQILQMGITILLELVKGITQMIPTLIPTMVAVLLEMVNVLLDNIDLIIECAIELMVALADGLIMALPEILVKLPEIIQKIINALINLTPQLISAVFRMIVQIALSLLKANVEVIKRIPEMIKGVINALKQGLNDFINVGVNFARGIWDGISSSMEWIKSKIKGWVGNVTKFIKKLFGIHSPSTVMRDQVGVFLAKGMGEGMEAGLDDVFNDMQKTIDLETSKMSANVQSSGTYQMAMAGVPTFNLVDNAENTTQLVVNGKVLAEVVNAENRNREVAIG